MRIGIYVSTVATKRGYERNVSGHIQVPLRAAQLQREAGHDVHIITARFDDDHALPHVFPDGIPLHFFDDSRLRGGHFGVETTATRDRGVSPVRFVRQIRQILSFARAQRFDVLHFYGFARTAQLAGIVKLAGARIPTVVTLFGGELDGRRTVQTLCRRVDAIVTATDFVAERCRAHDLQVDVVRHGIIRDLSAEAAVNRQRSPRRVLFWRDPSVANGADLCVRAFDRLAPRYPHLTFDFAVRPCFDEVAGLDALAERHPNVHVHRFPYPPGLSLPKMVVESLCVVLPFRELTIEPQLAMAESLAAGVPVVASALRSVPELISDGTTGRLVPSGNYSATLAAIEELISDPERAHDMGVAARDDVLRRWTWDRYVDDIDAIYARAGVSTS